MKKNKIDPHLVNPGFDPQSNLNDSGESERVLGDKEKVIMKDGTKSASIFPPINSRITPYPNQSD